MEGTDTTQGECCAKGRRCLAHIERDGLTRSRTAESQAGEPARKLGRGWEIIGAEDCPIQLRRTVVSTRFFKILWHRFFPNASDEAPHDHPRSFLTLVLRGGYDDVQPCSRCRGDGRLGRSPLGGARFDALGFFCPDCDGEGVGVVDEVRAPTIRFRRAEHAHVTRVGPEGATTLVVMGPLGREWGFWRDGRWYEWRRFERLFGLNWRCP